MPPKDVCVFFEWGTGGILALRVTAYHGPWTVIREEEHSVAC